MRKEWAGMRVYWLTCRRRNNYIKDSGSELLIPEEGVENVERGKLE